MSTPLIESLRRIEIESDHQKEPPSGGRGNWRSMLEATLQGPHPQVADTPDDPIRSASVDIDREATTRRDRIAPRVQVDIGTYSLAANTPLMIRLPRWARQVIIQNNTDLGGTSAVLYRSIDGTPATPGDFIIRQGQTVSDDVYTPLLSLYCPSANTINGKSAAGIVVEVSS